MTPEQFCYWLQGRCELQPDTLPTEAEWKMIREHLQTVFVKVTPPLQEVVPITVSPFGPEFWRRQTTAPVPLSGPPYSVECSVSRVACDAISIC